MKATEIADFVIGIEKERDALKSRNGQLVAQVDRLSKELGVSRDTAAKLPAETARADEAEAKVAQISKTIERLERQLKNSEQRNAALESQLDARATAVLETMARAVSKA
jgi:predicted RNase H-like nuclease (RuvC/YqgF family)